MESIAAAGVRMPRCGRRCDGSRAAAASRVEFRSADVEIPPALTRGRGGASVLVCCSMYGITARHLVFHI